MSDAKQGFEFLKVPDKARERALDYMDAYNGSDLKQAKHRLKTIKPIAIFFILTFVGSLMGLIVFDWSHWSVYYIVGMVFSTVLGCIPVFDWIESRKVVRACAGKLRTSYEQTIVNDPGCFTAYMLDRETHHFNALLRIWKDYLADRDSKGPDAVENPLEKEVLKALGDVYIEVITLYQYYMEMHTKVRVFPGKVDLNSLSRRMLPACRHNLYWARKAGMKHVENMMRMTQKDAVRSTTCELERIIQLCEMRDRLFSEPDIAEEDIFIPPSFDGVDVEEIATVFIDDPATVADLDELETEWSAGEDDDEEQDEDEDQDEKPKIPSVT